ncbi:MAG TPA: hypothetical protein ENJ55_07975 [Rhizobiales bacterium]|nr:hypothetical protein [Hyphomicrobiales bacterium]
MKALLFLVGLIFVVAGVATGVVSQMDYGNALIGLNLGLAATLLVGGFIVIGLSALTGAVANLAMEVPEPSMRHPDAVAPQPAAPTLSPPPLRDSETIKMAEKDSPFSAAPAAAAAAGATVGAAGMAIASQFEKVSDGVSDGAGSAIDKVAEVAAEMKKEAASKAAEAVEAAKDGAESAVDKVVELAEKAKDATSDVAEDGVKVTAEVIEDVKEVTTETVEETVDAVENLVEEPTESSPAATDEAEETQDADSDDEEDTDQLYVVEELVIRGKPARVLSDNTVEAETAEGWMRFENIEHLEEYLDAMEA